MEDGDGVVEQVLYGRAHAFEVALCVVRQVGAARCAIDGLNPEPVVTKIGLKRRSRPGPVRSRHPIPHFPYQPCRACRNQQQRYPM